MSDLFTDTLPKKDQLYLFIKDCVWCPTSKVIRWGLDNFHTRAERDARDLATEGRLRRLTDEEKRMYGFGQSKEEVWRVI